MKEYQKYLSEVADPFIPTRNWMGSDEINLIDFLKGGLTPKLQYNPKQFISNVKKEPNGRYIEFIYKGKRYEIYQIDKPENYPPRKEQSE